MRKLFWSKVKFDQQRPTRPVRPETRRLRPSIGPAERLTSTARRTSLNTERCFLLSTLARCLFPSVARVRSICVSESMSSQRKSWRGEGSWAQWAAGVPLPLLEPTREQCTSGRPGSGTERHRPPPHAARYPQEMSQNSHASNRLWFHASRLPAQGPGCEPPMHSSALVSFLNTPHSLPSRNPFP